MRSTRPVGTEISLIKLSSGLIWHVELKPTAENETFRDRTVWQAVSSRQKH